MNLYAGVDLGGTTIKCGIVDGSGTMLNRGAVPTGRERPYGAIAADIAILVRSLATEAGGFNCLCGVGIGAPGTVDGERGTVVYSNNIPWEAVPLGSEAERLLQRPVRVTNDANAAALGEYFCGAGKRYDPMLLLTLGTGIGGGAVLGGKLYAGNRSAGAEFGHMVIRMGGERCTCGRRGCLEAYASASALIRQTVRAIERHPHSRLLQCCGGDISAVDGTTAFKAARAGDRAAAGVVSAYIRALAEGVANLANVFRPQAVVLGGGICGAGETLLAPLRRRVNALLFGGAAYAPVEIVAAQLGNDAGIYGAARLAMDPQ